MEERKSRIEVTGVQHSNGGVGIVSRRKTGTMRPNGKVKQESLYRATTLQEGRVPH